MPALAPQLPPAEITPRAATEIYWLERRLGRRYRGWEQEDDGMFCVTLQRGNGRAVWCFGATLEAAVLKARRKVTGGSR
ncbi:hypothetical protein [Anaeromyxobacter oryzisoli]|uniref:hypothetical protein n=1 Tax=Anaeromyxobacter oryzisoli TaxID=2925408 RepID=UPI001F571903|nr:hypothetical protein [Anaeromyxobacter sp. SG63]